MRAVRPLQQSLALAIVGISIHASAAGLGQQAAIEEIVVHGHATSSLSAASPQQARAALNTIAGAIGFVSASDFSDSFTQSLGDTLVFTPGVYADTSAQRENRISIRGSGLNASFERRGLSVLRDGVPISRASGITEFQEIDPTSIQYIEVYKGANGLQYGASSLGGAINIVTPTGSTTATGATLRLEGGSFGSLRSSVDVAGKTDQLDYYGTITQLTSDGFRDHSAVDSRYAFGNIGVALGDTAATRFYFTALSDEFELAGNLDLATALSDSTRAATANTRFDQDRNLTVYRLANRSVAQYGDTTLRLSSWYTKRELDHAITPFVGIIDQHETETGLALDADGKLSSTVQWRGGIRYAHSENRAKVFVNALGRNGPLTSQDQQTAHNTSLYGQLNTQLTAQLSLITSAQYIDSQRRNRNQFPVAAIGAPNNDSGVLNYYQGNGRLGVLWQVSEHLTHFANISQGYEPPGISDITAGGALPFTPLAAQESITYELGSRGQRHRLAWDGAIYHSRIKNEFIDIAAPSFGGSTVTQTANALGDTIHQGVELGLDIQLRPAQRPSDTQLQWRNILTYNDFRFDNDPLYGNNTLAGVPTTILVSELRFERREQWHFAATLRHIPRGAYVDYANTLKAGGYDLLGLSASRQLSPAFKVFMSAENILDKRYIANVSTVADLRTERSTAVFTPGEGRAVYMGISYRLQ